MSAINHAQQTKSPNVVFDVNTVRADFPILNQTVNKKPLVYLDNGATTQKPKCVIDAISQYYQQDNSNVHRGAHTLSDRATVAFEEARKSVQAFINAEHAHEIIWTRGTTESINIVAQGLTEQLSEGDEIMVSAMEHHANIVPWQMLCERTGATLKVMAVNEAGELDMEQFAQLLNERTKLVAIVHVSNALGTINPVEEIINKAHSVDAKVLVDGAQAVAHFPVDVQSLNADYYAFSAHKVFGPTGLGVLYGKEALLNALPPSQGGGEMIEKVSFSGTTYQGLPFKFEAGTPNIAGVIGLNAALEYVSQFDRDAILAHENALLNYAQERAQQCEGMRLVGTARHKASVMSFLIDGTHPADVGTLLDQQGVAVRTGHHCAMPIMEQFGIPGTARASFSIYNTLEEIDAFFDALEKVKMFLM